MKKLLTLIFSLSLAFGLAACSSGNSDDTSNSAPAETQTAAEPETVLENDSAVSEEEAEEPAENEGGKTLVVYFSATGNTEEIANDIVAVTGADVFELEPVNAYTDEDLNYNDDNSRVVREHDNPDEQNIELAASTVENWEEYDTVFIGYAGGIIGLNQEKPINQGFALV